MKTIEQIIDLLGIHQVEREPFDFGPKQLEWLDSLDKHPERQLKGRLGIRDKKSHKACCLGEYGLITDICEFSFSGSLYSGDSLTGLVSYKKVGLHSSSGSTRTPKLPSLAELNDQRLIWPEIATYLRHFGGYYFHKSL